MNAPAYKPAKMLVKLLATHTPLPYTFNVTNSTHLINDLCNIPYDHHLRLASFGISNMYTNIPTQELLSIIDTACDNNLVEDRLQRDIINLSKRDIINLSKTIIDQNYFQFEGLTYKQNDGLAMGAPTSFIFSEFYLQHQENSKIYDLLRNHNVVGYFRYVDDILIIYNESTTNIENLFHCFNSLNPNLKFTLEKETGRRIHFLDLTIHREHNIFSIDIYRKPTFTDAIIPNDSCHPVEQKLAAIHFLYNRWDNYHVPLDRRQNEVNTIQQILHNNGYSTPARPTTRNFNKHEPSSEKPLWARFSYYGKETRAIIKAFKSTKIKVTYSTKNTLKKLLMGNHHPTHESKYEESGIYQISCPTCNKKYTGQTGRSFKTRFREQLRDFKNGYGKSRFAQHLLDNRHAIGPMNDIMDTLYFTNKGRLMDGVESFFIFRKNQAGQSIKRQTYS